MVKYTGSTGEDFVALQLALDFEGMNEGAKKPEAPVAEGTTTVPEINAEPAAQTGANAMDGGAPTDGTVAADSSAAPDKGTGEEAKKETAAPKKPAAKDAAPANPGYSPILDDTITMIGVSNKSHKKTINVIQVLYCGATGNAMV